MKAAITLIMGCLAFAACSSGKTAKGDTNADPEHVVSGAPEFNADSAYNYVAQQVAFGPRVPNTEAHRNAGKWLADELRRHGAEVSVQEMTLTAFDGTQLQASNIIGQYNPDADDRLLLLAHWDSRPWADKDPDPNVAGNPVDGANDGASGVGVLLEIARLIKENGTDKGIDILFVDAEDWGDYENEESWALGARYFANNPFKPGYRPAKAILLDMVGGKNARFYREYFSTKYAGFLVNDVWDAAVRAGMGERFSNEIGTAVTDDHIEFLNIGIPAIDIIEYNTQTTGFPDTWHTGRDNMENIDKSSLKAVGQTLSTYIYE